VSLIDALLLEACPLDVWVAVRSDGVKGSGTQSDPYDGSTRPYPAFVISGLTKGGADGKTATATTNPDHGFASEDWVTISGVGVDATSNAADVYYLGTFQISLTAESNKFTYRMLGVPTSDYAPGDAKTCCREREQFDTLMRAMPESTAVHLGPGVFETKGLAYSLKTWEPKSGQKILGSGMGVTTLKLVGADVPETHYWAIGAHYYTWLHDVEVSDFTIDCNVSGQPGPYVTCGAVDLKGRHIRIRRIRAIHFGSHSQTYVENFVIVSGATHPNLDEIGRQGVDCVIEDCIAERPSPNPVNNSTILHHGGGERPDGVQAYHRGCAIRNCYVNGEIVYGTLIPLPINSIGYDAAAHVVTVTTRAPHLLTRPGNVVVRGVTVSGNPNNLFNGVFGVASVESATTFKYELVTTATPDASSGYVGGGVSSIPVAVQSIVRDDTLDVCPTLALHDFQAFEDTYLLTTREPHGRTRNNNLRVRGVQKPNPLNPALSIDTTAFNGVFAVDDYLPSRPNEVQYTLLQQPDAKDNELRYGPASANMGHQALSADNGTGTVVEGNRVFHCSTGGPFHDTWPTKDLIVRNNYYHDVRCGPFQNLSGISTTPYAIPLVSLFYDSPSAKAKATTSFPHGFVVGDRVTVSSSGDYAARYNGLRLISDVATPREFWYSMDEAALPAVQPGYSTYEPPAAPGLPLVTSQKRLESLFYTYRNGKHIALAATTYDRHGFTVGEVVKVSFAGQNQYPNSGLFNGIFRITAVPGQKTFECELSGNPGVDSSSADFAAGYFGKIWQTHSLVIENNVIELNIRTPNSDWGHPGGLRVYGTDQWISGMDPSKREYSIVRLVARGNIVRNVDDTPDPGLHNRGIEVGGCERALIESNVVGVPRPTPSPYHLIEYNRCGEIHTLNNQTPAGELLTAVSTDWPPLTTPNAFEVVTKVRAELEDTMVSAFLKSRED
jgi:hypothetical protein